MIRFVGSQHWEPATLQDLVFFQRGFDITKAEQREGEVPVVSSSGIKSYHNQYKAMGPGVIIGRKGTLGSVYYSQENYWPHDTTLWSKDLKGNDAKFVYYALKVIPFERFDAGAANPTLNRNHIHNLPITLPNIDVQKKISNCLGAYDYLIENNKRRIELLEESAQQLYKEWFVRFRFPGHEHVKIIDGVPEGWEAKKVGELLAKVKRPGKIKKDEYLEEGTFPCVDQSQSFIGGYTEIEEAVITSPLPLVVFGDHTRVLKFIDFPFACGADGTQLLYPNTDSLSVEYFYFALVAVDLSNYFYARHFKFLKDQIILIPTDLYMSEFTEFARENMRMITKLRDQNHELVRARDLLLPKLMSGEIAV